MKPCRAAVQLTLIALAIPARGDVILQYFESRWQTIERRMPDLFVAGYAAVWLPPPGKADTGPASVGYDVFDRFDLGSPGSPTQYGTFDTLRSLIDSAHAAGVNVYSDTVLNHNGFRDHTTPGFETGGGYPGFAVALPGDPFGDFHDPAAGDRYGQRISGLIDIAQEKNHTFIRHPVAANPQNLPNKPIRAENRALYPDSDLPANSLGIHPFNLADPLQGDPYLENATGVLLRYTQWMIDVVGVDGFRIDAQKHIPEWFFTSFFDNAVWQRGRPNLDGTPNTPFSFGEVFDGSYSLLAGYIRKDGFGNRDVKDFPLYFALSSELNGAGLGSWGPIVSTSVDFTDGPALDGSRGVTFVQSHDSFPPAEDNLAYAFILTRPGYPIVYFNAAEFGSRPFPKDGRGDALGDFGPLITTLVDIHNEYVRDAYIERFRDNDVLVYERSNMLLVGLDDNTDVSVTRYDERTVQTNFDAGTRLHELTGNAANALVDPLGQIDDVLVVAGDRRVTIRVPRNATHRGYVIYGPANPDGALSLAPLAGMIAADPESVPTKLRRKTDVPIIAADAFDIELQTVSADALDPHADDQALFRIDGGGDHNGDGAIDLLTGEFAGFEEFRTQRSPLFGGGAGLYRQTVDATALAEGYHYLKVIAFRQRDNGGPIFETWPQPFYLDREPPTAALSSPALAGHPHIASRQFPVEAVGDRTVARVHVIVDAGAGADVLPLVNPSNEAARVDARLFRWTWDAIWSGNHTVHVVAFEETGSYSVTETVGVTVRNGFGRGPGDMDLNGFTNFNDIDPFIAALIAGAFNPQADVNGDGRVNFDDIDPFVTCLVTLCP